MNFIRWIVCWVGLVLIAGGYAASQIAWFQRRAAEYAQAVDTPAIRWLSFLILAVAIILVFVPEKGQNRDHQ